MKLLFSYLLLFTIAILNFWFTEGQSWFLIVLVLIIPVVYWRNIIQSFSKIKLGLVCFILLGIFFHAGFSWYRPVQVWKINANSNYSLKIIEKFKNHYIAENENQQRIFLSDTFYKNGFENKLDLFPSDVINSCFTLYSENNRDDSFNQFLKSKKVTARGYVNGKCEIKIEPNQKLYKHFIRYFAQIKNQKVKKWIYFLLFQIDSEEISSSRRSMREMGISHLFIISGFHLLVIGKFWFWMAKKRKNQVAKVILKGFGWTFCLALTYLTNWKFSAVKALILLTIMLIQKERENYLADSQKEQIAFLGLCFLFWNPWIFYQLDFQLSFLASWILSSLIKKQKKSKWKQIQTLFTKNWAVLIMILPVLINLNYRLSLWTPLFVIVYSVLAIGFYFCFFWIVWIRELEPFLLIVFTFFENNLQFWTDKNILIPFGEWMQHWVLAYYLIILLLMKSYWMNLSHIYILITWLMAVGSIFGGVWFGQPYYHLHMINVGHGMAMFLQNPSKTTNILFDAGSGRKIENNTTIISNYLKKLNVWKLDAVFISHQDADHYNNLKHLKEEFWIKRLVQNQNQKAKYKINELLFNNLAFDYYERMIEKNNQSLILQFQIEKQKFLFTFDAEKAAEEALLSEGKLNSVDVLQVGHHGSATSSKKTFLDFIQPKHCLISNQKTAKVKKRLIRKKCLTYTTKNDGHIMIKILPKQIKIILEKNGFNSKN